MPTFHRLKKEVGVEVLNKYGWECQVCGKNKSLCVHHIERKEISSKDYNNIDNLTVVCRSCHMSLHRKAGHIISPKPPVNINKWGRRGKNNPPIICKEEGCDRLQHGKSLCKMHYQRMLRSKK